MKRIVTKVAAVTCSMLMFVGCGDIVIKVQKKPKNVDLSAVENFNALNLQNSEDFLKHMDGLKVIAVDFLMQELASRDYRSEVRNAIREYRKFVIARATSTVKIDDSFYYGSEDCRQTGLNFNMDHANGFLGLILKTAVLAKLSEVNANTLNPAISKEVAAVGQLVLMELGLKVEGDVAVEDVNGQTKTTGTVMIQLLPIAGEEIDAATLKADAVEVMNMSFSRMLGADYVGTFDATIDVAHSVGAAVETIEAKLAVERQAIEEKFVHKMAFTLGAKGGAVNYARNMMFEQVAGNKKQVKVTDMLSPGTEEQEVFVTIIDLEAGNQCKFKVEDGNSVDAGPTGGKADGDECGFADGCGTDGSDGNDGGSTDGGTDAADVGSSDGQDVGSTDAQDGGSGDDGKGTDGDDDPTDGQGDGGGSGGGGGNNPGQNPGQHPGQSPGQHK